MVQEVKQAKREQQADDGNVLELRCGSNRRIAALPLDSLVLLIFETGYCVKNV